MKEIVYDEAVRGVFEPVPTRAQKREAKRKQARRAKKTENMLGIAGFILFGVVYATAFTLCVFAEKIWPVIRP